MAKLTKKEEVWVARLQAVIDDCPSKRIQAYTIGDPCITLYDGSQQDRIHAIQDASDSVDFCTAVEEADAELARVTLPFPVHSTAG